MERAAPAKPARGSARKARARGKRREGVVAKSVRAEVAARDGYCAMLVGASIGYAWLMWGVCDGPSEWAHIGQHRRCHTRGMAPEARHTTKWSAMLCRKHHRALDAHEFDIQPQTAAGLDGPFAVVRRAA